MTDQEKQNLKDAWNNLEFVIREHIRSWGEPQDDWTWDKKHLYQRVIEHKYIEFEYEPTDGGVRVSHDVFYSGCGYDKAVVWIDMDIL